MRLCYNMNENPTDPETLVSDMLEQEYYATLGEEDALFENRPSAKQRGYITAVVKGITAHSAELDGYIEKYAVGWRFGRISRTAVAILKTAMYEILYMPDVPNGVAINEAVELAKKYEQPETVPFINGILGSFARAETVQA